MNQAMKSVFSLFLPLAGMLLLLLAASGAQAGETTPKLDVQGVSGPALANTIEALRPPTGLFKDGAFNPLWLNRYLRQAPDKVSRALQPFGYYSATTDLRVDRDLSPPVIAVTINPGPQVRVVSRQLEISGFQHRQLVQRLNLFPLEPGSVLLHLPYEQSKAELQATALDLGYLDAHYSRHQITVDRQALTADLELTLETGPRYHFGAIRISGGESYPERFLRRYLTAREGALFSSSELSKTQQQLLDSDRFSSVVIVPLREEAAADAVPVEIRLTEKAPKRLRPGVGYGTDTGARAFLRYQDVNAWGLGHEFSSDLLVAERQQNLTGNYLFPGYRNIDTMLALRGGYHAEELDTYDTSYVFAETEQLYGFTRGRVGSIFLRLQQESSTFSGDDVSSRILMPGLRLRIGKLDDPVRPKRGYFMSMEIRGTSEALVSDISLTQVLADVNWIHPLPWRTFLRLRGSGAVTLQENEFDDIPASLRFFTGGDRSVRGYAYQSLGPEDDQGEVVGGKHLLVGSLELEKRFLESWGAAVFYDAGNAFDSFKDYELTRGVGIGLRYFTPVGPARVDLAKALDDGKGFRVHIGLGVGW